MDQRRHEQIDHVIRTFISQLRWTAGQGITQYVYTPSSLHQKTGLPYLTNQELLAAFQQRFPDCAVYWMESEARGGNSRRSIVIDWA